MGVEPFLVASSVEGILAQRLVRRICPECAAPFKPEHADLPDGFTPGKGDNLMRGTGCRNCRNTGYRGRIGLYELLQISDATRDLIMDRKNAHEIAAAANAQRHLTTLRDDGYTKARAGMTTLEEVVSALAT
jgi:general secretion pathway protein E/type IV pilus assembly protein PilB